MLIPPITLGFSPCPNDTFIFDALVHQKIDTEGLSFDFMLADVEELNKQALHQKLDMVKVSFFTLLQQASSYQLLTSGSALGRGCGPLLVAKEKWHLPNLVPFPIAIPGIHTTAYLLLQILYPSLIHTQEVLFSEIEKKIVDNTFKAGLLIHENRFTYAQRGLVKLFDLGQEWEQQTQLPIPLGGIVVRRNFPLDIKEKLQRVMKRSVQYAFDNPTASTIFVAENAQEMDEQVMRQHIALYVTQDTLSMSDEGKNAIDFLARKAMEKGLIQPIKETLFI